MLRSEMNFWLCAIDVGKFEFVMDRSMDSSLHLSVASDRSGARIEFDVRYHMVSSVQITDMWNLNWSQYLLASSTVVAYMYCDVWRGDSPYHGRSARSKTLEGPDIFEI